MCEIFWLRRKRRSASVDTSIESLSVFFSKSVTRIDVVLKIIDLKLLRMKFTVNVT